jgi:hypothetical protein
MKDESEETYVFAPQITQKSLKILKNRDVMSNASSFIDRRKMDYLEEQEREITFKPKINNRSNNISGRYERSSDALFQDAMRRHSQQQTIQTILNQKANADKNTA